MNETTGLWSVQKNSVCPFEKQFFGRSLSTYMNEFPKMNLLTSILASILAPLNAISNLIVLIAILRTSSLRKSKANLFICSLAFADFLVGFIYLPLYAVLSTKPWYIQECLLYKVKSFTGWIVESASFNIILTICYERYIALFYSLRYLSILSTKKIVFCLIFPWFIAAAAALLFLLNFTDLVMTCAIIFLMIGTVIILFTYTRIFKLVRRHHHQINAQQIGDANNAKQRKLAVTMAYVIGVSLICYLPYISGAVSYVVAHGFTPETICLFQFGEVLFAASSFVNPLIYCIRNEEMRNAVLRLLREFTCKLK